MILFIAPDPHKVQKRDGYLQRIAAIDEIFKDEEKIYSENLKSQDELVDAMVEASIVYVHSIYKSEKILASYETLSYKIVTDLHGVVPEENELMGMDEIAKHLNAVEKTVFRYGKYFVAVTDTMADYLRKKHSLKQDAKWITLPIFDSQKIIKKDNPTGTINIVYAGGTQKWQNVDRMIEAIKVTPSDYHYTILTPNIEDFSDVAAQYESRVAVKNVASAEVYKYYEKSDLGFILRDDTIVNNVACPTKLIEYLNAGVVPVVLSANIGDFKKIGYAYFTLNQLTSGQINKKDIEEAVKTNHIVMEQLDKVTKSGASQLQKLYEELLTNVLGKREKLFAREAIKSQRIIDTLQREIANHLHKITELDSTIKHREELLEQYKEALSSITESRRWKISGMVANSVPHLPNKKRKS